MLRDDLLDMGHDGACDALCGRSAVVIIAEAAATWTGECDGCDLCDEGEHAAIAAYCEAHVPAAPHAARAVVEYNAEWYESDLWRVVLDAWPQPVALTAQVS